MDDMIPSTCDLLNLLCAFVHMQITLQMMQNFLSLELSISLFWICSISHWQHSIPLIFLSNAIGSEFPLKVQYHCRKFLSFFSNIESLPLNNF